jgi:hypothetical protein
MRFFRAAVVALAAFVAVACGSDATAPADGDQGIRGVVVLGPTCPVETEASPCPDRPMQGVTIRVLRDGTPLDVTATSDPSGRFQVRVPPGDYMLEAVVPPGGPGMFAKPIQVTVSPGAFVEVTVRVDSAIR